MPEKSYIYREGVSPNTQSVVSSKNRIFARSSGSGNTMQQVGVISTFDPSQSRAVEAVRGIGFGDQIAELVPGVMDVPTLSVTRTAMYLSNIFQAFGYNAGVDGVIRSLKDHTWPFDVRQELVVSGVVKNDGPGLSVSFGKALNLNVGGGSAGGKAIVTYYEACWITDYSTSYAADAALVAETVTISVSDILGDLKSEAASGFDFKLGLGGNISASVRFGNLSISGSV